MHGFMNINDINSVCNTASVTKSLVAFSWNSIDFYKKFLDDCIFRENRLSDSHNLLKSAYDLHLYITCLLTYMDEIWCVPPHDTVRLLRVSWNLIQWKLCFTQESKLKFFKYFSKILFTLDEILHRSDLENIVAQVLWKSLSGEP
jgi:hypothetical protein